MDDQRDEHSPLEKYDAGHRYEHAFDPGNLRENEDRAGNSNTGLNKDADIQSQEENATSAGPWTNKTSPQEPGSQSRNILDRAKGFVTNKKSATGGIIGIITAASLFGFGFFGLYVGPIAAVANTVMDLSDPLSAVEEKTENLLEKKIFKSPLASGDEGFGIGCGRITGKLPIKCRYGVASKKLIDKLNNAGIEILSTKKYGPLEIAQTFRMDGQDFDAEGLQKYIKENPSANLRYKKAKNTNWLMMKGGTYVRGALGAFGVNQKKPVLEGDTAEEKARRLKGGEVATTTPDIDPSKLVEARDENGNLLKDENGKPIYSVETGNDLTDTDGNALTDTDGNVLKETDPEITLTEAEVGEIKLAAEQPSDLTSKKNPLSSMKPGAFKMALASVNYLGGVEMACTLKNNVKHASVLAKVRNAKALVKYALPIVTLVGALQANDLGPEEAEVVQKIFYDTDAREFVSGFIDNGDGNLAFSDRVKNPDYGKNVLDSDLFRMSEGHGIATQSLTNKTYSQGFGFMSFLRGAAQVAGITSNVLIEVGTLGQDCGRGTMLVARWGGLLITGGILVASIATAPATLGTSLSIPAATVVQGGVKLAIFVAAFAALDNLANRYFNTNVINETTAEAPLESAAAIWTGIAALNSEHSMQRGMMPAGADEIVAYQQKQNIARQEIIALQRQDSSFFDINNPYSTTGSIALAVHQSFPKEISASTMATIPSSLVSFINKGARSLLTPNSTYATTIDKARYEQCDDENYKEIGIDADVQCNVRFVMPEESMQWDPLDTAEWMEENGYVEENTTTGYPEGYTPPDQAKAKSFAEDLVVGTVNDYYHTRVYSTKEEAKEYGKFLEYCVYRALPFGNTYVDQGALNSPGEKWITGEHCRDTSREDINRFRAYVFDMSVNDDLDESPIMETGDMCMDTSGTQISMSEFKEIIAAYNLPEPDEAKAKKLLEGLKNNKGFEGREGHGAWAAKSLLAGEKKWKAAGGEIKEYLTTAWVWYEIAQDSGAGWPDPYFMNCGENRDHSVAEHCSYSVAAGKLFQVAGYQAQDRANDFVEFYKKMYSEDELPKVLEDVLTNSSKAYDERWDYSKGGGAVDEYRRYAATATLDDISPNKPFTEPKAQFLTTLLGKDPSMAAALNSVAVTDNDIGAMLKDCTSLGWSNNPFYCNPVLRPTVSNMMLALYLLDSESGGTSCESGSKRATGTGLGSIVAGNKNPENDFGVMSDNGLYAYGARAGLNSSGRQHTGIDIMGERGADVFTPVSGKVKCSRSSDAGCGAFNSYKVGTTNWVDKNVEGTGRIEIEIDGTNGHTLIIGHTLTSTVSVGDRVEAGQKVGTVGWMNSHHIHLEYRIPDTSTLDYYRIVDPAEYLK